jgi:hypothetical protein
LPITALRLILPSSAAIQLLDAIMGPGQNRHFTLSSIAADNSWSRAAMPSFKKPRLRIP